MTRLNLNLRALLQQACGQTSLLVPAEIEVDELLDFNDLNLCTPDLDELLAEQRLIAAVWSVPDVLEMRPDLSEDQGWKVLQQCHAELNPLVGLCRQVVARTAYALYGAGNAQRAERCQEFLATYDGDDEAKLVQLLTDARHWCDSEERDYALLDRVAQEHYLSDLTEEPADEA